MLTRLLIQNLATIEKQIIEFKPGFTVLTGETGAGKSVLIKALRLILGEKCSKELIRTQESFLEVEAVFQVDAIPPILTLLQEMDIEHEGELTIRRKVYQTGKNTVFLNDRSINLNTLASFAEHLVDLHGQHGQQTLLVPAYHTWFLDAFAGLQEKVQHFTQAFSELTAKRKQRSELERGAADRNRELDFLKFQVAEIEKAGFSAEEETALYEEAKLLVNGEVLIQSLSPIAGWATGEQSPLGEVAAALQQLKQAVRLDPKLQPALAEFESGLITLEEAAGSIASYVSKLEINPERLETVNQRLSVLDGLKRKYGATLVEINHYRDQQLHKLEQLEKQEFSLGTLEVEIKQLKDQLLVKAEEISQQRKKAKKGFEKTITDTLKELGMERSRFEIRLERFVPKSEVELPFMAKGIDLIEFLIATNPDTPLKPLAKIASGGELSRIMLAIKTALNFDISFGSMIFDEVDSGISGRVAETVGDKLSTLGHSRQIICITHSPQIAAKAPHHMKVEKIFENNVSKTLIHPLDKKARIEEIAQFLGGNEISDKTRAVAADMLTQAN